MATASYFFLTPPESLPASRQSFLRVWLPVLVLLALFCVESSAMLGANHTSAPLHAVVRRLSGAQAAVDSHWSLIHHLIRKTGHFLGYGVLSLAWLRGLMLTLRPARRSPVQASPSLNGAWPVQLAAIAATFAVAALDELHQSFLPNRTGQFSDVLLDTAGALTLQIALRITLGLVTKLKATHAGRATEAAA